jgi:hypothetical protein
MFMRADLSRGREYTCNDRYFTSDSYIPCSPQSYDPASLSSWTISTSLRFKPTYNVYYLVLPMSCSRLSGRRRVQGHSPRSPLHTSAPRALLACVCPETVQSQQLDYESFGHVVIQTFYIKRLKADSSSVPACSEQSLSFPVLNL